MQSAIRRGSGLLLLGMLACSGSMQDVDTATAAASDAGAAAATAAPQERPYKGWCDTRFEITNTIFDPVAQLPVGFDIDLSGVCQLTHLGRTEFTATQHVTFNADGSQAVENEGTLTAANGDTLQSALSALGAPVFLEPGNPQTPVIGFTFEGTDTYSAGTGRFAAASGSAALVGSAFFDPPGEGGTPPSTGSGHYEVSGTISY